MKGQNLAYVRVSSVDQNEERQIESLKQYDIDKWFIEKKSARDRNRPELKKLLEYMREGDKIYIVDFSRIARNVKDLLNIIDETANKKVNIISIKENFDTTKPSGKLMIVVIGAVYQFEVEIKLENQLEGIALAKKQGKYKGRKKIEIDPATFDFYYQKYLKREITKKEFAEKLNISRPTLDKLIKSNNY